MVHRHNSISSPFYKETLFEYWEDSVSPSMPKQDKKIAKILRFRQF